MAGRNEREMRRMAAFVEGGTVELGVKAMRLIHGGTVRPFGQSPGTPVDTGEHRSGGRVGLNSPPTFVPPPEASSYPIMGDNEIDEVFANAKLGDDLYWANRAPVSELLEEGLSAQAPDGFLEFSIDEAIRQVEATEVR